MSKSYRTLNIATKCKEINKLDLGTASPSAVGYIIFTFCQEKIALTDRNKGDIDAHPGR